MTLEDRQLKLDIERYRDKTKAGMHDYCSNCIGKHYNGECIFSPANRSVNKRCAKAFNIFNGLVVPSAIEERFCETHTKDYAYGLKKSER